MLTERFAAVVAIALISAGANVLGDGRVEAQAANQTTVGSQTRSSYASAAVRATAGSRCKLHAQGIGTSPSLDIYVDEDGYARFHAVRQTPEATVRNLVLDCVKPDGQRQSQPVDLSSDETFAPHRLALGDRRGRDRPALKGDPLGMTQIQLLQSGYGLRPDPDKDKAAYSRWLSSATKSGRLLESKRPSSHSHTVTTRTSPWWVGSVLTGAPDYVSTTAVFNVPTAIPGGDKTTSTGISVWNGLGGFSTGSGLIQGGVDISTTPTAAAYSSFREYCCGDGDSNGYAGDFSPNPGDQIFSQEWYCDSSGAISLNGGFGCTFLHDLTSGAILSCTVPKGPPTNPSCWSVKALPLCSTSPKTANCMTLGAAAEFIVEDTSPQILSTSTAFTDFLPALTMSGSAWSSTTKSYSQTISNDPTVTLLTDFTNTTTHINVSLNAPDQTIFSISPTYAVGATIWSYTGAACNGSSCLGWRQLDDNPATVAIAAGGGSLYQLHNSGKVWRSTGTPCSGSACPGWQQLDFNNQTTQIVADNTNLYQLHTDGSIWRSTGTPCSASACPGWQKLDANTATTSIAADGGSLEQLHNDGSIWRYTGTPCSASSCLGWQELDTNTATTSIAAGGGSVYQLHNDGSIWRYTGTPCSKSACPGWQKLDSNISTVAIAAARQLYQLHVDGSIWRHTGTACNATSCPGWQLVDNNTKTVAIAAGGDSLFQLHNDGKVWRYTGTPCGTSSCPGWQMLDTNSFTGRIAAANNLYQIHTDPLYQLHTDGSISRYVGTDCNDAFCPGWAQVDNNPGAVAIAAGDGQLYQLHRDGSIWRHSGSPCNGSSCVGWIGLDNNPSTVGMSAAGSQLYQLHRDGSIWRHTGASCGRSTCPGWLEIDNNHAATAITASGNQVYQLHADGSIWRHTGRPCNGASCPGWEQLDQNPAAIAIVAGAQDLFQLHRDGSIWRYTGTPCRNGACSGWQQLDKNPAATTIQAAGKELVQLHKDGSIWLYTGTPCNRDTCAGWQELDNNSATVGIATSGAHVYQRHRDGSIWRYAGPPCSGSRCPGWSELDNNGATNAIVAGGFN